MATANDDEENRRNRQAGTDLLERAGARAAGKLDVESRLLEAEGEYGLKGISEAIAHAAEEWGADLLVVGTKGRRGLERLVIGSVAEAARQLGGRLGFTFPVTLT